MRTRPQALAIGAFVVRRDAARNVWRVFRDGREVFVAYDRLQAESWARTNDPDRARSSADGNPLIGWGL